MFTFFFIHGIFLLLIEGQPVIHDSILLSPTFYDDEKSMWDE
ncbi:hypothetical protein B4102_4258 [Heyndrickxia sporothermodurans]|uniref:Uncharacterized protein n=1 Tax=Heyndrickxia sporothermodurans TaxID=46224 RepID=A0A150KLP2_9BACI|nr:hypothetical protein B4102_4258 [Heyndrickxia sporothermodurans]